MPEGLTKSDWSSIRAAYEAGHHAFQPVEGGWQARNPGQQWTTKFDQRGFEAKPQGGGLTWGLELESYGFGEKQTPVSGTPEVKAQGQRHSYPWDATVQGWFVNDRRGQEHGFTLVQRPRLPISEALLFSLTLSTSGGLPSHFTADSAQVQDASGTAVLNDSGLKVWEPPTS